MHVPARSEKNDRFGVRPPSGERPGALTQAPLYVLPWYITWKKMIKFTETDKVVRCVFFCTDFSFCRTTKCWRSCRKPKIRPAFSHTWRSASKESASWSSTGVWPSTPCSAAKARRWTSAKWYQRVTLAVLSRNGSIKCRTSCWCRCATLLLAPERCVMCQTPSERRTNAQTLCSSIRFVCQRRPSYLETKCDASYKCKGTNKNPGSYQ